MKRILLALMLALALALLGCGGSSQYVDYMPPAPTSVRKNLEFGYYGNFNNQNQETADHVSFVHEPGWFGVGQTIASMREHGKPTILGVQLEVYESNRRPLPDLESRLDATFGALKAAGVLSQVRALYPVDEPENYGLTDSVVTATNARIRSVADKYPELSNVKLAVIYTNKGLLPGFSSYDWIGMDAYEYGPGVLVSVEWRQIMDRLAPNQGAILVPGGASPWKQDPEAFRRYAQITPQVIGIMPFMWATQLPGTTPGIGANGMAEAYRAVGREIVGLSIQRAH